MKTTAEVLLCKVYGNKSDDSAFLSVIVHDAYILHTSSEEWLGCSSEHTEILAGIEMKV